MGGYGLDDLGVSVIDGAGRTVFDTELDNFPLEQRCAAARAFQGVANGGTPDLPGFADWHWVARPRSDGLIGMHYKAPSKRPELGHAHIWFMLGVAHDAELAERVASAVNAHLGWREDGKGVWRHVVGRVPLVVLPQDGEWEVRVGGEELRRFYGTAEEGMAAAEAALPPEPARPAMR